MEMCQEVQKRVWKHFDPDRFREKIGRIDWSEFFNCVNIDILNDIFEEKVIGVLEEEAPMKFIQTRNNFVKWLDEDILQKMKLRDNLREHARNTDDDLDWAAYRKERNDCTKLLKSKKDSFFKNIFEVHCETKNVKGTYNLAKNVMGWASSSQPKMFIIGGRILRKPVELAV